MRAWIGIAAADLVLAAPLFPQGGSVQPRDCKAHTRTFRPRTSCSGLAALTA
jgi:hypothetical protein